MFLPVLKNNTKLKIEPVKLVPHRRTVEARRAKAIDAFFEVHSCARDAKTDWTRARIDFCVCVCVECVIHVLVIGNFGEFIIFILVLGHSIQSNEKLRQCT